MTLCGTAKHARQTYVDVINKYCALVAVIREVFATLKSVSV